MLGLRTVEEELEVNILCCVVDAKKVKIQLNNFGEFLHNQIEYAHSIVISKADMPDGNTAYVNYAGVFAYCFVQWLKLCMCVAMSVAVCSLSRSFLFAVSVSFLCIFCAVLSEALTGMGGSSWAARITSYALPDFRYLESSRLMAFAPIDFKMLLNMGAYSAVYIVCALALAAWFYSRRDF